MRVNRIPPRIRSAEGFTLIEVLVALLILTIGLMGLEALGIGAARSVSLSRKQSEYSTVATSMIEGMRSSVEALGAPMTSTARDSTVTRVEVTPGDTALVSRVLAPLGSRRARLTVRVAPTSTGQRLVRAQPIRLDTYFWHTNLPR